MHSPEKQLHGGISLKRAPFQKIISKSNPFRTICLIVSSKPQQISLSILLKGFFMLHPQLFFQKIS